MFATTHIRKHERGLWFRDGDFHKLLMPGKYRIGSRLWSRRNAVQIVSVLETAFEHQLLDLLVEEDGIREEVLVLDLNDNQRALVWKEDRLAYVVGPGRHAYWKGPYELTTETFDVKDLEFTHPRLETILRHPDADRWLQVIDVEAHEEALVFLDGELVHRLSHGRYAHWRHTGRLTSMVIDKREQIADVAGQDIMTSDKVTLRVNLLVVYQIADPVLAVTTVSDHAQALYREAQLVLRAAIGTRSLDALLHDKEAVGGELAKVLKERVAEFGLAVRSVGLRDIILPGEMKAILNQVIEAEKKAQANLIRRREETAAARSQANTAKLLVDNPTLARMREMEVLSEILAGSQATFVLGNGRLLDQVRSLAGSKAGGDA